jgi:hypothetical protein
MKTGFAIFVISALLAVFTSPILRAQRRYTHDDSALQRQYEIDNDAYFDGSLPRDIQVVWSDIPRDADGDYVMAVTDQDVLGNSSRIEIDTKSNITGVTEQLSLFHELCHVSTGPYVRAHGEDPHGPAFTACMHRLADERAFEGLW